MICADDLRKLRGKHGDGFVASLIGLGRRQINSPNTTQPINCQRLSDDFRVRRSRPRLIPNGKVGDAIGI